MGVVCWSLHLGTSGVKVIVVTLVHRGEVTICKVFAEACRTAALSYWDDLNNGKATRDEVRISIEEVAEAEPKEVEP